jgi:hypothetical protein
MLKLYHSSQSRSVRPRWLLEEIGAPYELVHVDLSKQEHKTPGYLKIHHRRGAARIDGDFALMSRRRSAPSRSISFARSWRREPAPRPRPPVNGCSTPRRPRPPVIQLFGTPLAAEAERAADRRPACATFAWVADASSDRLTGKLFLPLSSSCRRCPIGLTLWSCSSWGS